MSKKTFYSVYMNSSKHHFKKRMLLFNPTLQLLRQGRSNCVAQPSFMSNVANSETTKKSPLLPTKVGLPPVAQNVAQVVTQISFPYYSDILDGYIHI